jgi:8-oxo-dGTP pyrophosphatase MutT (NUDIX family)
MKRVWTILGRLLYPCALPALILYVWINGDRTRLVIANQGQVLVVKGWLGNGKWGLPGGGIHKDEQAIDGVLRELAEETGISLEPHQVYFIGRFKSVQTLWRFSMVCYGADLAVTPQVKACFPEIIDILWQDPEKLLAGGDINPDARQVLHAWMDKKL